MNLPPSSGWGAMECPPSGQLICSTARMNDGTDLFYRLWTAATPDLIFIIHGLGGHSGWYINLGNELAAHGLNVCIPDLRGFGRSGGDRGHLRRGALLLHDLKDLAGQVAATQSTTQTHLLGHSMGAILALHLAATSPFTSLALVNPWVEDAQNVSGLTVARVLGGGLIGSSRLWRLAGEADGMIDNPDAIAYLNADPFWVREESASFFTQVLWLRLKAFRAARRVTIPALIVQTQGDTVVKRHASRKLFEALASSGKEWAAPPACGHDFQFAADRRCVDDLLVGWFERHKKD